MNCKCDELDNGHVGEMCGAHHMAARAFHERQASVVATSIQELYERNQELEEALRSVIETTPVNEDGDLPSPVNKARLLLEKGKQRRY